MTDATPNAGPSRPPDRPAEAGRPLAPASRLVAASLLALLGAAGVLSGLIAPRRPLPADPAPAVAPSAPGETTRSADPLARRINVNTASAAELQVLPGIGPTLAGYIVADREANGPFATLDDLQRVQRIGPRTVERLESFATAE